MTIDDGRLTTSKILNHRADTVIQPIARDEFRLRVSDGIDKEGTDVELTTADFKCTNVQQQNDGRHLEFTLRDDKHELTVKVNYKLAGDDFFMRKQLSITSGMPVTVERIDVVAVTIQDAHQPYTMREITVLKNRKLRKIGWRPGLAHPLFTQQTGTFWGNDSRYDKAKIYYLTVGTERLMEIFAEMSKANPGVIIVISNGAYLSPWWLMHVDAVWVINAGDAAGGSDRFGQLVYRDGVYHDIWEKEKTHFPMSALFNHEPKKAETGESEDALRRYMYMNLSRGTGFIELYLVKNELSEKDWDVLAEVLKWAHKMFPVFKNVQMHGGDPKANAVYGYSAWNAERGYLSFHHPSEEEREYQLVLDRSSGSVPGNAVYEVS